jgi:hypothetical protein
MCADCLISGQFIISVDAKAVLTAETAMVILCVKPYHLQDCAGNI